MVDLSPNALVDQLILRKIYNRLVRRKHRLWNRWITTKNDNVFDEYKIVRNKVKRETVKIVQQEQDKISRDCESNPKRFWRYVNRKKTNKKLSYR